MSDLRATSEKMGAKKETKTRAENKPDHTPGSRKEHDQIMLLQRTIGNKATARLLYSRFIQPKLTVSHPNDIHEQEADRVADEVMRVPDPVVQMKSG